MDSHGQFTESRKKVLCLQTSTRDHLTTNQLSALPRVRSTVPALTEISHKNAVFAHSLLADRKGQGGCTPRRHQFHSVFHLRPELRSTAYTLLETKLLTGSSNT